MKTIKTIMKVLFASSLLLPFAAQAAPGECSIELGVDGVTGVGYAIANAVYTGKRDASDRTSLEVKLASAKVKVDRDKIDNAIEKLDAISDKASDWADSFITRKTKLEDASDINTAVTAAIMCVGAL